MEGKTAIVFGATGLVGNLLLDELESCKLYSAIRIFVRQQTMISIPGMEEIVTDFRDHGLYPAGLGAVGIWPWRAFSSASAASGGM